MSITFKKITALLALTLISVSLLTSCMARGGAGDTSIVGRWNNNGNIVEYRKNGEIVRNGRVEYYTVLPNNRVRVYTDRATPNRGRVYPYSLQNGNLNFDGSHYSPVR